MPRPDHFSVLVILLSSLFVAPVSGAQSLDQPIPGYVVKHWTTKEGLPHNSILALRQTRDGYLWIGMMRGGLVRFDGVTFTTFNVLNTPALGSDWVSALHEEADGTLWIGTEAGLVRYRDGRFTPEPLGSDDGPGVIADIRSDRDGTLWVAAQRLVVRRDGARWTVITSEASTVRPLSPAPDGTMWIATPKGLIEWRDRVVRTLTTADGLPGNLVTAVHEDRNGRVWIGTDKGLAHIDRRDQTNAVERSIWSGVSISMLFEDSRGTLWVGGVGRLLVRTADGAVSESLFGGEAESMDTRAFAEDREGHIWFGTAGGAGGLHRLTRDRVEVLAHQQGLPCDNVGPITEAADGTIWLATLCAGGRGIVALRNGRLEPYPEPTYVASLLAEPDGELWAGTFHGRLFHFDNGRFVEVPNPVARDGTNSIAAMFRDDDGSLWLGTSQGLLRWWNGQWTRLRMSDGLVHNDVRSIARDRDGALWFGTLAGISRYHGGQFTSYRPADGIPIGAVRAIHIDGENVVWIGTYGGGLARFKNGVWKAYGSRGGILDTSVHRIFEDDRGFFWLTGDHGIRRALKQDLNTIAEGEDVPLDVALYDETDGMPTAECNGMGQPAGWRMRDGMLYVPTQRGIVRLDPARLLPRTLRMLTPHVEQAVIDGVPSIGPPAVEGADAVPELVVPAGYRDVEIRYTAPAFTRSEIVQFRYRLDGYHADWIDVGTRRLAAFANLRPGRYRFLVDARHSGGAWSEQPAVVSLHLQAYVYQQPPFQIAMGVLALAIGVGAARWYVLGVRRRARELEHVVAERTQDLSRAHDSLSIAHESLGTAKREVEQAHGQVLAVLNQLDIGVLVLSAAGTVRYASASAQRVLRKTEQELVGQPWMACLPVVDADRPRLEAWVGAPSRAEERVPVQMVIGGTRYWAEIDIRDEPPPGDGRILYIYGVTEISALFGEVQADGRHGLIGRSTAVRLLHKQIRDVARVESTVLIQGETGVGKELVARAIHRLSQRADKPFIAVNAAGLSESLLASQLFGHRRGAFTGAVDDQPGVFEAANGGTLFLDEIGDMPPNVQVSLLRVLQEREITRLGESHARKVDVRFLAATHRDLVREVAEGRFREDLFYRVRVATIMVPPLRDRLDDVPLLVDAFLREAPQHAGRPVPQMSRDAIEALLRHTWPGNVRELKAIIERSLVNASGDLIRLDDLPVELTRRRRPVTASDVIPAAASDRDRLIEALRRARGNRSEAARLLGVNRRTVYRWLAEHGLDTNDI